MPGLGRILLPLQGGMEDVIGRPEFEKGDSLVKNKYKNQK